jgi:YVTN family beta-propeller protein
VYNPGTLAGSNVYVVNGGSTNVSSVDTTSNSIVATVTVGSAPKGFGLFIGGPSSPPPPPPPPPTATPIPGTLILASLGVALIAWFYRRRLAAR